MTWANTRGRPHHTANRLPAPDFSFSNENSVTKNVFVFFSAEKKEIGIGLFELNGMKTKLKKRLNVFHSTFFFRLGFQTLDPECCSD